MKTHELANILRVLRSNLISEDKGEATYSARFLQAIDQLANTLSQGPDLPIGDVRIAKNTDDMAVGLRMLLSLSGFTKQQWISLVSDYDMQIQHNPRDSARDVMGKVLRFLEAHPEMVRTLGSRPRKSKVDTSELENTLTKLLERKNG